MKFVSLLALSCLVSDIANAASPPPAPSAQAALEQAVSDIRQTLASKDAGKDKQQKLRKLTEAFVDYNHFAERTLADAWVKLSAKQKKDFTQLLAELVEASYVGRISEADNVDIHFISDQHQADHDEVEASAKAQGSDVHFKFTMVAAPKGWQIDDIELDDVSLVRNYKSQFAKTIAKTSYAGLVGKLQKKVAELKTPGTQGSHADAR